jgi:hypothetical protein
MTVDSLSLRIARRHVRGFRVILKGYRRAKSPRISDEDVKQRSVVVDSQKTMDCRDCQSFLQSGIDAFKWLERADQEIRSAIFDGSRQYDPKLEVALATLYAKWLEPCKIADKWIKRQIVLGCTVENLDEFNKCREEVEAIVEFNEGGLSNPVFIKAQEEAMNAHGKAGETHELWPESE